jgi:uncharacterized protein YqeY
MSLLKQIQTQQLHQRRLKIDPIAISLLTTLLGEATAVGKNAGNRETTDAEVVAVVKKFLKNVEETLQRVDSESSKYADLMAEKSILEGLLPRQMTETELENAVKALATELGATGARDMGRVMKELKTRYEGTYDGSRASAVCKAVLG